jgi:hypothetical protein
MQCGVVLSEAVTATSEVPDAIGWRGCVSYVVECKISRSDFHAEKHKRHVRSGHGIGQFRYILCPDGVLQRKDVEGLDYGLLVWPGYKIFISTIKAATRRESCQDDEITMLVSACGAFVRGSS